MGCGPIAIRGRGGRPRRLAAGRGRPAPRRDRPRRHLALATATGSAAGSAGFVVVFVARLEALELLDGVDDFSDVEERVALEADVDERRLHPGQDLRDPALVDVADDAALILALDEDLDDLVVLEDGDARVVGARRR